MHGLFGILSMAVRPYTITYMVAGGVGDPPDDLNKRSKPLTRLEAIAPDGNDNFFFTDKITTEAIHCDTNNYNHGASQRVVPNEKRWARRAKINENTRLRETTTQTQTNTNL